MSQKSAIEKQPIIEKAALHEGDTGSPEEIGRAHV